MKYHVILVILFFAVSCMEYDCYSRKLGCKINIPWKITNNNYTYIHIVRDVECTRCSIGALVQWNDIIKMIGRNDFSYIFIVEPYPTDREEDITKLLNKKTFEHQVFVDFQHEFISLNPWLSNNRFRKFNDFIIDGKNQIVGYGNPFEDLLYLKTLNNLE